MELNLNKCIIVIENKDQYKVICEILKEMSIKNSSMEYLDPSNFDGPCAALVYNKMVKTTPKRYAIDVFKDREVIDSLEFISKMDKKYVIKMINDAMESNVHGFVKFDGTIPNMEKKSIFVENEEDFIKVVTLLEEQGFKPEKNISFKGECFVHLKNGHISQSMNYTKDLVATRYSFIKSKFGVKIESDGILSLDYIAENDKVFKFRTKEAYDIFFQELDRLGAVWFSGEPIKNYDFGMNFVYGAYVSTNTGELIVIHSKEHGGDLTPVYIDDLIEERILKGKSGDDKKKANGMVFKSRLKALQYMYPGKYNFEIKGFRFSDLKKEDLISILSQMSKDNRFKAEPKSKIWDTKASIIKELLFLIDKFSKQV